MDIKEKILNEISFRDFFSRYLQSFNYLENISEYNVLCPFHNDDTPSLSLNIDNGIWFCHSCGFGGSIFDFFMRLNNVDFKKSVIDIAKEFKIDIGNYGKFEEDDINNLNKNIDDIKTYNQNLLNNLDNSLDYVINNRGLSRDIIKKYLIGYSNKTNRTTFPIFDNHNNLLNVRQHSRHEKDRSKGFKVIGIKGFNKVRLYPHDALDQDVIFIFAGEFDCMLGKTLGIEGSITKTGPEKYWNKKWNIYFKDKKVIIVYDNDKAGEDGALLIANSLYEIVNSIKIINLPVENVGEDFTDYIVNYDNNIGKFYELVDSTKEFEKSKKDIKEVKREIHQVKLEESSLDKYYNKVVSFKAICAGKDLNPYLIPRKAEILCSMIKGKECVFCPVYEQNGSLIVEYSLNDPDLLEFISSSQTQKIGMIKKKAEIFNCQFVKVNILQAQNIEECFLVPSINFKEESYEDVYRKIYYLGQGLLLNQVYDFNGLTVSDPRDSHAVVMINQAKNSDTDIDTFKIDDVLKYQLKIFQPEAKSKSGIYKKFEDKYNNISNNITQIYNRLDLQIAIDLVYHSALKFKFQGAKIDKCHIEALIIGDTRTGKSVSAKRLIQHYRAGEIINCEKATIPGLIGGTYDLGQRKILTWGIIPRNDRRLVVLDEADGIDTETISNLSGIRSSCIAERTIAGGTRKAIARTRLLWLANPRGFKNLSEYTTGIEAVKILIGKPEDIARFDFCLAINQKDVPIEVINKQVDVKQDLKYTSFLCNKLVLWAWSRKEENIKFTEEATKKILEYAVAFGKLFSSDIPIVHPNEQRIKIARLSVAVAIATFSTDNGEDVIIEDYHVEFVIDYLMDIFSSPSLSYMNYSKNRMLEQSLSNEEEVESKVRNGFSSRIDSKYDPGYFILKLLTADKIKFDDIMDALQTGDREEVREVRQYLLVNRCIKKEHTFWRVTEPFRFMLRRLQKEKSKSE